MSKTIIITESQLKFIEEYFYNRTLLSEQYKHLLIEESSVSNEVKYVSKEIERILLKNPYEINYDLINYGFIGELLITFKFDNFNNVEEVKNISNYESNVGVDNLSVENNKLYGASLELKSLFINDKPLKEYFYTTIMHEVNHLYQEYMKLMHVKRKSYHVKTEKQMIKNDFDKVQNKKYGDLYKLYSNNTNHNNPLISQVCRSFYRSDIREQDSYSTQLYNFITKGKKIPKNKNELYELYYASSTYGILNNFKEIIKTLQRINEQSPDYKELLSFFKDNGIYILGRIK